jgi:hypothetical protein
MTSRLATVRIRAPAKKKGRSRPSCLVNAPPWPPCDAEVGDALVSQAHGFRQCAWQSSPAGRRGSSPSLALRVTAGGEPSHAGPKGRVWWGGGAQSCAQGYECRSGDARWAKQIAGQSMATAEKKGVLCPRDRQAVQAPQGAIIPGAFHTVFPRKRGKQRQHG